MDQGQAAAFAGALDRPPTSSWEIINPREYEKRHIPAVPLLPDIHPLVDKLYKPYDIGQVGQLDVHILTETLRRRQRRPRPDSRMGRRPLLGRPAAQRHHSRRAGQHQIPRPFLSLGLEERRLRAGLRQALRRAISAANTPASSRRPAAHALLPPPPDIVEQVYSTNEGPVVITTRGKLVFVSESFPLDLARKLTALVLDAQGTGELKMAHAPEPVPHPAVILSEVAAATGRRTCVSSSGAAAEPRIPFTGNLEPLTANLIRFFSNCGVMKAVVDAEIEAAAR